MRIPFDVEDSLLPPLLFCLRHSYHARINIRMARIRDHGSAHSWAVKVYLSASKSVELHSRRTLTHALVAAAECLVMQGG